MTLAGPTIRPDLPRALPDLLTLGSRWTFVGGKGGVGKTTLAAALAIALADRGRHVLALSTDPAHSLGDAFGVRLSSEPAPVPRVSGLEALEIDPAVEQRKFLASHQKTLIELIRRGSVLDEDDLSAFGDLVVPGADELAALFRLLELGSEEGRCVIVDTAPTGHTLRLLDLPSIARGWLDALRAMEEKERAVALAFQGSYAPGQAADLLNELYADLTRFTSLIRDPERTRFTLVTNPEPVVLAETRRYEEALAARQVALAGIIVNRAGEALDPTAMRRGMVFVPRFDRDPRGPDRLRAVAAAAFTEPPQGVRRSSETFTPLHVGAHFEVPTDRSLYVVGGKGGVGKSTVAGALAIDLAARRDGELLLLGIDPAGSLADVLATRVCSAPASVEGASNLHVQQLVAESAWRELRAKLRADGERILGGMLGRSTPDQADSSVTERWLELAPPGVDELMALLQVIDLTSDRRYDAVVVDTAPTGHLLRLLELPELALQWVRALLRTLLKYREIVGLGSLAEKLLHLSRDLRSLQDRLHDPETTWFVAVALPEMLGVPETRRLLTRARKLGVTPDAVLLNRVLEPEGGFVQGGQAEAGEIADIAEGLALIGAPALPVGPVGVDQLAAFARAWRTLEKN